MYIVVINIRRPKRLEYSVLSHRKNAIRSICIEEGGTDNVKKQRAIK